MEAVIFRELVYFLGNYMSKIFNQRSLILIAGLLLISAKSVIMACDYKNDRVSALSMTDAGSKAVGSPAGTPVLAVSAVPSPVDATAYAADSKKKSGKRSRKGTKVSGDQLGFRVVSAVTAAAAPVYDCSPERRVVVALKSWSLGSPAPAVVTADGSVPSPARVIVAASKLVGQPAADAAATYYENVDKVAAAVDESSDNDEAAFGKMPKLARRAF